MFGGRVVVARERRLKSAETDLVAADLFLTIFELTKPLVSQFSWWMERSPHRRLSRRVTTATPSLRRAATRAARSESGRTAVRTAMSIALFCVAGPLATIMNRRTMLASAVPIPITISAVGMAVTALASRVALRARPGLATHNVAAPDYLRVCLPIGAAAAMSLALGLQAYLYLSISFVQMLKAFTPVIVLGVTVRLHNTRSADTVLLT